jgi:glycosyltransferase involved in cell wall biosynthesis
MKTDPLISVVICVYNGERFLGEAIDSVFGQDYRPIEVIVVDDGSDDRSAEIATAYPDVRLVSQENRGVGAARNAGIAAATGAFIAFLDADDVMLPSKVSEQAGYLFARPEVGYVLCRQKLVPVSGSDLPAWARRDPIFGDPGGVQPTCGLVRRTALERAGGFDPSVRMGDGMEWLSRLREAGIRIDILPKVLLLRRVHEDNLTHDQAAFTESLFRTLKARADRAQAREGDDESV